MTDTGVIDNFLDVFLRYIDSGFGLVGGEVGFLSSTLVAIDVTLAALFWSWGPGEDILQRLVRKCLYVGVFAFIIGNFSTLADILFRSFAGLGLKAGGGGVGLDTFMRPGSLAGVGIDAGSPLLEEAGELMGVTAFFANFVQIAVLLLAWAIIVIAFFILAVQVFVTLIEFKLVTLAGFLLLPFALFGRTAFMAERVLGHIVSSGIKVLVLGVITAIGSSLFEQFLSAGGTGETTAEKCLAIALAALALMGLGMFGPGIATGIVTGGPQLGAGSAAGTAVAAGGMAMAATATAGIAAGAVAAGTRSGALLVSRGAGGTSAAFQSGAQGKTGLARVGGGAAGVGRAAAEASMSPLRRAADAIGAAYRSGQDPAAGPASPSRDAPPGWARAMRRRQNAGHGVTAVARAAHAGDGAGGGATVDLQERE
ncbi:P-type conjugative transfer protein TrbL [Sphingobium sp. Cam5-1]|jgi:type IV secretion system protein TrbL|uniref:P-type conjugative transfer protein TrbL n=1 Tax=Sphingobium sp. Cam5-1 TaxID=2789327 RepID=UPI0018AD2D34|nr:P-type conjugative transfer protein TrbL [Sphingobium sp. Cam5-1]QPI73280.1 P-type conjugative transfer protein TrbL [Sphingobium sp. Cam5-1]